MRTSTLPLVLGVALLACQPYVPPVPHRAPEDGPGPRGRAGGPKVWAHFIDVGQADAILFEFPCGAMLVDTGSEVNATFDGSQRLREYLTAFFRRRADLNRTIDLLLITHSHIDHVRGITDVLLTENPPFRITHVVTNGEETSSGAEPAKRLHAWAEAQKVPLQKIGFANVPARFGLTSPIIDPFRCEDVDPEVRVLYGPPAERPKGWEPKDFENYNNHSLVVRVDFGKGSFLLLGDLEEKGIDGLLSHMDQTMRLDVDVVKVGHHGSWNGTSPGLVKATSPDIAVIQMGSRSRHAEYSAWTFGHPREEAVKLWLEEVSGRRRPAPWLPVGLGMKRFKDLKIDRAIYGTGWDGTVIIESGVHGHPRRVRL